MESGIIESGSMKFKNIFYFQNINEIGRCGIVFLLYG